MKSVGIAPVTGIYLTMFLLTQLFQFKNVKSGEIHFGCDGLSALQCASDFKFISSLSE
jgi:hypothetical protein